MKCFFFFFLVALNTYASSENFFLHVGLANESLSIKMKKQAIAYIDQARKEAVELSGDGVTKIRSPLSSGTWLKVRSAILALHKTRSAIQMNNFSRATMTLEEMLPPKPQPGQRATILIGSRTN